MLYMKTRVTFRLSSELADELKELPNQTHFVEAALRDALGVRCPACDGTGRLSRGGLAISNFRANTLPPLNRPVALELKQLVRVARQLQASRLELSTSATRPLPFDYVLTRGSEVLLTGTLGNTISQRPVRGPSS